ncbi:hypothetical protein VTO42DRAFT_7980 [Malbranchea cinnamomea]
MDGDNASRSAVSMSAASSSQTTSSVNTSFSSATSVDSSICTRTGTAAVRTARLARLEAAIDRMAQLQCCGPQTAEEREPYWNRMGHPKMRKLHERRYSWIKALKEKDWIKQRRRCAKHPKIHFEIRRKPKPSQKSKDPSESSDEEDILCDLDELVYTIEEELEEQKQDFSWMRRFSIVNFYKLKLSERILDPKKVNWHQYFWQPTLEGLDNDILGKIFSYLDPPAQIALALTNKTFAILSLGINNKEGILYSRGDQLRLLWLLKPWMPANTELCLKCRKYLPVDPYVWLMRRQQGRHRTGNWLYGKFAEDYEFEENECPECRANRRWENLQEVQGGFLHKMYPGYPYDHLKTFEFRGGWEKIKPLPLPNPRAKRKRN